MWSSLLSSVLPSRFAKESNLPLGLSCPTRLSPYQQRWRAHLQALLTQCDTLQQHWVAEARDQMSQADPALANQLKRYPRTLASVNRRLAELDAYLCAADARPAVALLDEATLVETFHLAHAELVELNQALQAVRRTLWQAPALLTARLIAWVFVTLATLTSLLLAVASGTGLIASASVLSIVTVGLSLSARFLQEGLTLHGFNAAWQARGWRATARLDQRLAALQTLASNLIANLTDTPPPPDASQSLHAEPWLVTDSLTQRGGFFCLLGWPYA